MVTTTYPDAVSGRMNVFSFDYLKKNAVCNPDHSSTQIFERVAVEHVMDPDFYFDAVQGNRGQGRGGARGRRFVLRGLPIVSELV